MAADQEQAGTAFVPLTTQRLVLRPPRPQDADALFRLVNDWAVVRMLSRLPFPYPRPLMDEWIFGAVRQAEAGTGYHLVITKADDPAHQPFGCVGLTIDPSTQVGKLGYWVGRRHWSGGVATEAVGRVASWALQDLRLPRVEAQVAVDNPASAAVLRRLGFQEIGTGRDTFRARGGTIDVLRFAAGRNDLPDNAALPGAQPAPTTAEAAPEPAAEPTVSKPVVLVAACALIDADGRVLLARRPEGKPMAGLWEFPGGKVHPGETPEAALIRELNEELGIDVAASCLAPFTFASHAYERFHLLMPLYVCRKWQGRPEAREGQVLAWVRPNRLAEYPMPEADKPLVPMLRDLL